MNRVGGAAAAATSISNRAMTLFLALLLVAAISLQPAAAEIYLVRMSGAPVSAYTGSVPGFAATAAQGGKRADITRCSLIRLTPTSHSPELTRSLVGPELSRSSDLSCRCALLLSEQIRSNVLAPNSYRTSWRACNAEDFFAFCGLVVPFSECRRRRGVGPTWRGPQEVVPPSSVQVS